MRPSDINWPLLTRYLSGAANAAGTREVHAWRDASPDNAAFLAELSARWRVVPEAAAPSNAESEWHALRAVTGLTREVSTIVPRVARRPFSARARSRRSIWTGVAVFAAGAAAAGIVAVASLRRSSVDVPAVGTASRTYRTQVGQMATVSLADHRITLAPQTTLVVEGSNAYLTGEALFEHDSAAPNALVVHARNARIRELGTVFSVRAYADDPDVRIAVREGKVSVGTSDARGTLLLAAQDVGRVAPSGDVGTIASIRADSLMTWTTGTLVFEGTPLAAVIPQLSRWYGLTFSIPDPTVGQMRLTMTFRTTDSVDAVVDAIGLITGTDARRRGTAVTITRAKRSR